MVARGEARRMGAKTCLLVYCDRLPRDVLAARPPLDREAAARLAASLFPAEELTPLADTQLWDTYPPEDEIRIGVFDGLAVVVAHEFGLDRPSELPKHFLTSGPSRSLYLHAMHSVVDWCAIAHWREGELVRALSLSPESGVIQDRGEPLPFEQPFWAGKHPAVDPEEEPEGYPLRFHPLEFGEAALMAWLGFVIEGYPEAPAAVVDLEEVPLLSFRRRAQGHAPGAASAASSAPNAMAPAPKVFVPPPPDVTAHLAAPKRPWWQFWRR